MIRQWHDIKLGENVPREVNVLIEISKGSSTKYEIDNEHGLMMLDRFVYSAVHYPGDYGFIPQTYGGDNNALDILVYTNGNVLPQTIALFRPIGVMRMIDTGERDDKIIGVYVKDPRCAYIKDLKDLPEHTLKEYREFFETYKNLEGKKVKVLGFMTRRAAYRLIREGIKAYEKKFKRKHRR